MHYLSTDLLDELNAILTNIDSNDARINGRIEVYICKRLGQDGKKLFKRLEQQYHEDIEAKQLAMNARSQEQDKLNLDEEPRPSGTSGVIGEDAKGIERSSLSSLGPMDDAQSRKILFYLISTLNMAFPDYDFSSIKAEHFSRLRMSGMVNRIHNWFTLSSPNDNNLAKKFWAALEQTIGPESLPDISENTVNDALNAVDSQKNEANVPRKRHRTTSTSISAGDWDQDIEIYSYEPDDATGAGDPYDDIDEDTRGTIWRFFYFFYNRKLKRILFFTMKASAVVSDNVSVATWEDEAGEEENFTPVSSQQASDDRPIIAIASSNDSSVLVNVNLTKE